MKINNADNAFFIISPPLHDFKKCPLYKREQIFYNIFCKEHSFPCGKEGYAMINLKEELVKIIMESSNYPKLRILLDFAKKLKL